MNRKLDKRKEERRNLDRRIKQNPINKDRRVNKDRRNNIDRREI